jgi:hypothetical protein
MPAHLARQCRQLKAIASENLGGSNVARLISEMALHGREMLQRAERIQLTSRVAGKRHFGFRRDGQSRAINQSLYVKKKADFNRLTKDFERGFEDVTPPRSSSTKPSSRASWPCPGT